MGLFGTAGIRGLTSDSVTPSVALRVGRAVGTEVREADGSKKVVVGRDGRVTSSGLAYAVISGLVSAGAEVRDIGEVPTPVLAFASRRDRGIMVTASHNPPEYNGLKFFNRGREYTRPEEEVLEDLFDSSPGGAKWTEWTSPSQESPVSRYLESVETYAADLGSSLDELRITVECGNGMASLTTPAALTRFGGSVVTVNANIDGYFPGRTSKPTPESLGSFREFVQDTECDLGIAHDGDADRLVVVQQDGEIVHEDTILAILAEHYVRESDVGDPVVVTTPNTSNRVDERVRQAGGRVVRTGLGELQDGIASVQSGKQTAVVFAAEPWKHIHPEFGWWIDGIVSAVVIARLISAAGSLTKLRREITERPYQKRTVECPEAAKSHVMCELQTVIPDEFPEAEITTEYGIRVGLGAQGWLLVRPSGTEPVIRVYCESQDVEELLDVTIGLVEEVVEKIESS